MEAGTAQPQRRFEPGGRPRPSACSSSPAPIADPGPLGLAGFALTTFVLSMFNAKLVS